MFSRFGAQPFVVGNAGDSFSMVDFHAHGGILGNLAFAREECFVTETSVDSLEPFGVVLSPSPL